MTVTSFFEYVNKIFKDETLFGFSSINDDLADKTGCKCALVTLLPYPDLQYMYNAVEYFTMLEDLRKKHIEKLNEIKVFLDTNRIKYATPPASPKDNGEHMAEFSYKWAAIHAGLGFIGKNDVLVHYKYAQRVRISCLLINFDLPVFSGDISSKCGKCSLCVEACPHKFIIGHVWHIAVQREELIDYRKCATKSKHSGKGQKYLCAHCSLACTYPSITL